ncbi:MAG TPA: cell division protein FtsZ [Alteraurantiacibacter sp.]|jgi:cell division protein FtsZ
MSINIGPPSVEELRPRITVIGVGGAGGNAIANMIAAEIEGVDFIVANTDAQSLNSSTADHRIQLGPEITQGLGAGSRPEVGRAAAEETADELERALDGVNMCFIAAGMGGGTGTGAAPVIAEVARRKGVLTVGVVTKPFLFEGTRRMRAAESGIEELQKHVDTLIVIPNQNLFLVAKAETTFKEAFQLADEVLQQGVRSITDLMVMPGLINLDFADVRSVMGEMGKAMMGTGEGEGENRALEAAERAIANPLLDGVSMAGAKGVIISIIGGEDMKLLEVDEAANHIRELVDEDANIIWGSAFNPDLEGKIRVSVVATGIDQSAHGGRMADQLPSMGLGVRGPKRPVLPLPTEEELAEGGANPLAGLDPLGSADEEETDEAMGMSSVRPFDAPTGEPQAEEPGYASAYSSDEEEEEYDEDLPDPADDEEFEGTSSGAGYASLAGGLKKRDPATGDSGDWTDAGESEDEDEGGLLDPLELTMEAADEGEDGDDELLLDASRLAASDEPSQDGGHRRRGLVSDGEGGAGSGGAGGGIAGGSTLFERMANLSRTGRPQAGEEEDEEEEDGVSSLNIPRFLGRQNNQ